MYTTIDQKEVDQKIHQFMARKSPIKTFSKTVAGYLFPEHAEDHDQSEISYEKIKWHHTGEALFQSRFQRPASHA